MVIKTVINADTGTADIVGGDDWDAVAAIVNNQQGPASTIVYKVGTTIKAYDINNQALITSGTTADVIIQAAIDALGSGSGKKIFVKNGLYTLTAALNFTAIDGYCHIMGEHNINTQLRPSGDFAAFDINGKTGITLSNMYLTHNQVGYTNSLLRLRNAVTSCHFNELSFYDFDNHVGNAIGFDVTSGSIFRNNFNDCYMYGFNNSIYASVPNNTFFCNGNNFIGCWFWLPIRALSLSVASGASFDNNNFIGCQVQGKTSAPNQTAVAFDYETNNSGNVLYTTHSGCIAWDLGSGINYANVNTTAKLSLMGCYESWKIGGTGAALGNVTTYDSYTNNFRDIAITNTDSPYTAPAIDTIIRANATSGEITINLPTAVGIAGRMYKIYRTDIIASTNLITIDASSTQTIDSNLTYILYPGEWVHLESDGANWQVISRPTPNLEYYYIKGSTANRRVCAGLSRGSSFNSIITSTTLPAVDTLWALPLVVPLTTKFDTITFKHTTNATAGGVARAGIYRDNGNMYPGALIFDTGSKAVDSGAGTAIDTTITAGVQIFQPGLYWLAWECGTAAPQIRCLNTITYGILGWLNDIATNNISYGYSVVHSFGVLPNPYTGSATVLTVAPSISNPVPAVFLRPL